MMVTTQSWFAVVMLAVVPAAVFAQALPAQVRVPERQDYTNAHMGPTSTQPVIVLVPAGTALPVIKKQGEWYLVKLAPELRKLGMRMRWYKNETQGWVHESTVEVVPAKPSAKTDVTTKNTKFTKS
jgi:hypothetical protein